MLNRKFCLSVKRSKKTVLKDISAKYENAKTPGKKLILGVLVGRSGMRWLSQIFSAHENAEGSCERNVIAESFYRYVKFNNLPVDLKSVIDITKAGIIEDWKKADISFVVSPYFSHDINYLIRELKVDRIIWGVNDPKFTVMSFYNKGWYEEEFIRSNNNLAMGYRTILEDNTSHFFGRVIPGDDFKRWESLTRVGKISWFYNTVNMEIYESVKGLPEEMIWVFKLEEADQNYQYYLKLAENFGLEPVLSEDRFISIKKRSVRKSDNIERNWNVKETDEFSEETSQFTEIYKDLK